MSGIDWTRNWFTKTATWAALPVYQGGFGSCVYCATVCYGAALRAYIQGYPLVELSQLYNFRYPQRSWKLGMCMESLDPRPPWQGVDTSTLAYWTACQDALKRQPSAEAVADASNHVMVDIGSVGFGTAEEMVTRGMAALDAGYILTGGTTEHMVCIWGYRVPDSRYPYSVIWKGPDSRSMQADACEWESKSLFLQSVIRSVRYANLPLGPKPLPLGGLSPPPIVVIPPPTPTGNNAMIVPQYQAAVAALVVNQITPEQLAAIDALRAQIVPDAQTPAPTPVPVPTPGLLHDIGVGGSFVSAAGDTWSVVIDPGNPANSLIKRNGMSAAGLSGLRVVELMTGQIKAQRSNGSWQLWGNGTWSQTGAP